MNVLQLAAARQAQFAANVRELNGYECFTTFYGDLTIAEQYGPDGVRETYDRVNKEWRGNYKYYTEFVLALNHKIWEHYKTNEPLARVYNELWDDACAWVDENFTGEAAEWFYNVTD